LAFLGFRAKQTLAFLGFLRRAPWLFLAFPVRRRTPDLLRTARSIPFHMSKQRSSGAQESSRPRTLRGLIRSKEQKRNNVNRRYFVRLQSAGRR
jgi:hypothetical protein